MILNNGTYNGKKILEPWTVDLIFHNYNTKCGWVSIAVEIELTDGSSKRRARVGI